MADKNERSWEDRTWTSGDGLRLHFRFYDGDTARPPVICLPGLTRNAREQALLRRRAAACG